jgi:hypothetical protein
VKTIILMVAIMIAFSGCSRMTPSVASTWAQAYDTTKTIWVKGEEIVVINADLLDEKTLAALTSVDEMAKTANNIKEVAFDGGKLDANISIDGGIIDRVNKTKAVIDR